MTLYAVRDGEALKSLHIKLIQSEINYSRVKRMRRKWLNTLYIIARLKPIENPVIAVKLGPAKDFLEKDWPTALNYNGVPALL